VKPDHVTTDDVTAVGPKRVEDGRWWLAKHEFLWSVLLGFGRRPGSKEKLGKAEPRLGKSRKLRLGFCTTDAESQTISFHKSQR
jgi:hypothetical protein